MKQDTLVGVVAAAAVVACGATWIALPLLAGAEQSVAESAAVEVERARRLLHAYSAGLAHKSLLLEQLADAGAPVDLKDPQALLEAAKDDYQALHETRWKAFQPVDWVEDSTEPARAGYGNLAAQIRDGVQARAAALKDNDRILDDALAAADAALAVSSGDVSARTDAEANRLKAVILFHKGLRESLRAGVLREKARPVLQRLTELSAEVTQYEGATELVAASGIDARVALLTEAIAKAQAVLQQDRDQVGAAGTRIADLEQKLAAAKSAADRARGQLEQLQRDGIDFSDPQGGAKFESRLLELDRAYRQALRQAQAIEAGQEPAGDGAAGPVQHGLRYFQNERRLLEARIKSAEQAVADARADIARLEGMKESYRSDEQRAQSRIQEVRAKAAEVFDDLNRAESEAFAAEDKALDLLAKSLQAAKAAAGFARDWVAKARERTQGMSPETLERSPYKPRLTDAWMSGHISAQAADAHLERARLYLARHDAHGRAAQLLAGPAKSLQLKEADADSQRQKATDAHKAGLEEVVTAVGVLEAAHREAGRHWTFVAQAAGANDLLAFFGDAGYAKDALEAYRAAVKGRENEPYAQELVARIARLEGR